MRPLFAILATVASIATGSAMDRGHLDRCETALTRCYEHCLAQGHAPSACNHACTTRTTCALAWTETYGQFIDRRIEDDAAERQATPFAGLTKLRDRDRVVGMGHPLK